MGQRSRKRRAAPSEGGDGPGAPSHGEQGPEKSPPRGERRDAQARAALEPLAPGERPRAVTVAALVAAVLGLVNLAGYLAGLKVRGVVLGPGVLSFTLVMAAAAWGMWRLRYWAVLGFQTLLALIILSFALFLVRANNLEALILSVAVIGLGGWLFWKLVRAMARIQMPTRPQGPGPGR